MSRAFESSSAGPLPPGTKLECGVCWWVYDPALGDEDGDILPGTSFSHLHGDWRCPSCDADKSKFMVLEAGTTAESSGTMALDDRVAQLTRAYEKAEEAMVGLPVHNPALRIEAVNFRPFGTDYTGIIITPWCMNIVVLPQDPSAAPEGALGASVGVAFPSGSYDFILGRMDGVGSMKTCSLFSPMEMFDDPAVAKAAADAALDGLFEVPKPKESSRRAFLSGGAAA